MKIDELISPGNVTVGFRATDKGRLIEDLAAQAAAKLNLSSEMLARDLLRREDLGSTGVGNGIALPHARLAEVTTPFGLACRLKKAIEFDAVDGKAVDLVVLLLLPVGPPTDQLNALACVARILRDERRQARLRTAKDAEAFYRELVRPDA